MKITCEMVAKLWATQEDYSNITTRCVVWNILLQNFVLVIFETVHSLNYLKIKDGTKRLTQIITEN